MSIEAMKQALKAFKEIHEGLGNVQDNAHKDAQNLATLVRKDCNLAMRNLSQAIAEAEKQEPVLLQVNDLPPFNNPPNDVIDAAFHVSDWAERNGWNNWRIGNCCSASYTHPQPKREWVGLTDEERQHFRGLGFVGVDQVEAKLREKNG